MIIKPDGRASRWSNQQQMEETTYPVPLQELKNLSEEWSTSEWLVRVTELSRWPCQSPSEWQPWLSRLSSLSALTVWWKNIQGSCTNRLLPASDYHLAPELLAPLQSTIHTQLKWSFIHCRHLYRASSSGTTQRRSQPQRGQIMLF